MKIDCLRKISCRGEEGGKNEKKKKYVGERSNTDYRRKKGVT